MDYKPHFDSGRPSTSPFTPTSTQMANKRSIPLLIASSMEGLGDGSEKIPRLSRGVPITDFGQNVRLRLQGQDAHINPATGSYTTDNTPSHTVTSPSSGDSSYRGSDQTLSDTILGVPTYSSQSSYRPIDTSRVGTSSSSPSADSHSMGQYRAAPNSTTNGGLPGVNADFDQTFWDLLNGNGRGDGGDDLDFSIFLQNLNDAA